MFYDRKVGMHFIPAVETKFKKGKLAVFFYFTLTEKSCHLSLCIFYKERGEMPRKASFGWEFLWCHDFIIPGGEICTMGIQFSWRIWVCVEASSSGNLQFIGVDHGAESSNCHVFVWRCNFMNRLISLCVWITF